MRINARSARGPLVVGVAAAVLAAGGAAAALAAAHDGGERTERAGAVTAAQAADAALKAVPGTVEEIELDDGGDGGDGGDGSGWEIDVLARDGVWHAVTVDSGTGKVLSDRRDRPDRAGDALRRAKVTAGSAAGAALKAVPGRVTSVDFEQRGDGPVWKVDVTAGDETEHEVVLDAATARVRADHIDED